MFLAPALLSAISGLWLFVPTHARALPALLSAIAAAGALAMAVCGLTGRVLAGVLLVLWLGVPIGGIVDVLHVPSTRR